MSTTTTFSFSYLKIGYIFIPISCTNGFYLIAIHSQSHPLGINGQNHIIVPTPMKFLPPEEFKKRQKSIDSNRKQAIMASIPKITKDIIENKKKARDLKEKGNLAFMEKKYEEAEVGFLNLVSFHL